MPALCFLAQHYKASGLNKRECINIPRRSCTQKDSLFTAACWELLDHGCFRLCLANDSEKFDCKNNLVLRGLGYFCVDVDSKTLFLQECGGLLISNCLYPAADVALKCFRTPVLSLLSFA